MKLSALLLPALLLASCTSVVTGPGSGETGGSTSSASSSSGSSSSTTSSPPPIGGACPADGCGPTGFCQYPYAACQDTAWQNVPYTGTCQPRPGVCYDLFEPVCGCNGQVYPNVCWANNDGQDLGAGACAPSVTPSELIPCGPQYCHAAQYYCAISHGDVGDTSWSCVVLPSACQGAVTPDCTCLGQIQGEYQCTVVEGQGVSGLQVELSAI